MTEKDDRIGLCKMIKTVVFPSGVWTGFPGSANRCVIHRLGEDPAVSSNNKSTPIWDAMPMVTDQCHKP